MIALVFLTVLSWPHDPAALRAACAAALGDLQTRVASIAARGGAPTFANSVLPLENAVSDARDRIAAEKFVWSVDADAAIVDASRECATSFRQTLVDVLANRRLYAAVARVANHRPHDALDRALTLTWADRLKRGGAALNESRHRRYVDAARELVHLEDTFWRNLARARPTIRAGRRTVEVDDGTVDFLRTERDADAREAFYKAYNRRAAAENVPVLEREIALRDRIAHALGAESWAEYRLSGTALKGYAQAEQFLSSAARTYAAGRPPDGTAPWDLARDDGSIAAATTVDDALAPAGAAFGLRFARAGGSAWAPGVVAYDVTEQSSQRSLGTLYVDLTRRPGKATAGSTYSILTPRGPRAGAVAVVASWPGPAGSISGDRMLDFYRLVGRGIALLSPAVPYETLARVPPETLQTAAALFERFARAGAPSARTMLEATALADIDLAFGSSGSHVDTTAVWQRVAAQAFAPLYEAGTYPQVASDQFAGTEAGLLVLQPWAQAYAADAYGVLAVDGHFDPKAGERFRRTVLAPGDSRRFEDVMRDFLGRDAQAVMP